MATETNDWRAPAKINLSLHVTGKRRDGFHLIESLVVFTRLGDRISIDASEADRFSIAGPFAHQVPADDTNLVIRTRDLLRDGCPDTAMPPVSIRLHKHLPAASGIGGGSSDAAATLKALARHWKIVDERGVLAELATRLGADVPMCLTARPLVAKGIGHDIDVVTPFPALSLLLVNPGAAVSTPEVFERLAMPDNAPLPELPRTHDLDDLVAWLKTTRNDLQAAATALTPQIQDVLDALERTDAEVVRMSGSGATCFGLYLSKEAAAIAAETISAANPEWFTAATTSTASGEPFHDQK